MDNEKVEVEAQKNEFEILNDLRLLKNQMEISKSGQRLPLDRNKAVAVTQMELVIAYWNTFVVETFAPSDMSSK